MKESWAMYIWASWDDQVRSKFLVPLLLGKLVGNCDLGSMTTRQDTRESRNPSRLKIATIVSFPRSQFRINIFLLENFLHRDELNARKVENPCLLPAINRSVHTQKLHKESGLSSHESHEWTCATWMLDQRTQCSTPPFIVGKNRAWPLVKVW